MAKYISDTVQRRANEFKSFLYESALTTGCKQEAIAYKVGQAQGVVSAYMNPESERNFPAFQIPWLPREMAIAVITYLVSQLGEPKHEGLNGDISDELRSALEALSALSEKDKAGAPLAAIIHAAEEIHNQVNRIVAETKKKQGITN